MLLLNELYELESTELWILWTGVPVCETDKSIFAIQLSTRTDAKNKARLQNEPYTSDIPVHTRWVVYSSSTTPDKKENDWEVSYWFILYFPIYVDEKIETP